MSVHRPIIERGDYLGVIALSSPAEQKRLTAGIKFLESLGFKIKVALAPAQSYGTGEHLFAADSAKRRAKALEELYKDKTVTAIISARGGYSAMEVLPLFDFKLAEKNRKPLIGFSDTTAFLVALNQRSKCATIHGPSVESFATATEDAERQRSGEALKNFLCSSGYDVTRDWQLERWQGKSGMEGEILGGNLSILAAMCGTPWQPKLAKKILFLEDTGEKPYRVHRMLLQMKLSGCFDELAGVLIGHFKGCEKEGEKDPGLRDVIDDIFGPLKVPIRVGMPAGHIPLNLPIPFGVKVQID